MADKLKPLTSESLHRNGRLYITNGNQLSLVKRTHAFLNSSGSGWASAAPYRQEHSEARQESAEAELRSTAAASSSRSANRFEALIRVRVCVCFPVCKPVRGDFTINIYVWQTDQWLLKRSRGDDDGYWLCVSIKSDHADKLQIHICAYIQYVRAHTHTHTYVYTHRKTHTGQMIRINSLIMLNLS